MANMNNIHQLEDSIVIKEEKINYDYVEIHIEPYDTQCQDLQMATVKAELDMASSSTQLVDEVTIKEEVEVGPTVFLPQCYTPGGHCSKVEPGTSEIVKSKSGYMKREERLKTGEVVTGNSTQRNGDFRASKMNSILSSIPMARAFTATPNIFGKRPRLLTFDVGPSMSVSYEQPAEVGPKKCRSRADYMREYRRCKREEKLKNRTQPKKVARNSTERTRDYRARKAAKLEKQKEILSSIQTTGTSTAIPSVVVNGTTLTPPLLTDVAPSTSSASVSNVQPAEVGSQTGKARADYMREYRQRKREERLKPGGVEPKEVAPNSTQRNRNFRRKSNSKPTTGTSTAIPSVVVNNTTLTPPLLTFDVGPSTKSASVCNVQPAEIGPHLSQTEGSSLSMGCNVRCDDVTSNKQALKRRSRHLDTDRSCDKCDYKCTLYPELKKHMRTHTGEKRFACDLCSYRCINKNILVVHMRTHTGENPFACELCSFKCKHKGNLVVHMRIHTGEKPYACYLCSYKSRQKSNLRGHMAIHTEDKPFACDLCLFKCKRKSSLERHMLLLKHDAVV